MEDEDCIFHIAVSKYILKCNTQLACIHVFQAIHKAPVGKQVINLQQKKKSGFVIICYCYLYLLLLLLLAASHKIEVQIFRSAQLSQNKLINFHPEKTLQAEPRCTVTIVTQMLSVLLNAFIYPNPHTYYPTTQRERSPKLKRNPYTDINASHGDIKMMGTLIQHVAVLFCH